MRPSEHPDSKKRFQRARGTCSRDWSRPEQVVRRSVVRRSVVLAPPHFDAGVRLELNAGVPSNLNGGVPPHLDAGVPPGRGARVRARCQRSESVSVRQVVQCLLPEGLLEPGGGAEHGDQLVEALLGEGAGTEEVETLGGSPGRLLEAVSCVLGDPIAVGMVGRPSSCGARRAPISA